MSLTELVDAYNSGTVTQETFIWTDGMDDWKPLAEVEAVVSALHASAGQPAAAPQAAPALAFEPPPPAAAPAPSFAAPMAAQASAAPAAEPKRAAVKREARGRDLFGTTDDVQTSAAASPAGLSPAVDDGKLTGQRNESSVLFSLAVLTKSTDQPAASAPAGKNKEDSGLIDLKALAAKAESMRPAAPAHDVFSAPLGSAPMPLSAPLGAVGPSGDESQPKSKLPLLIGGGLGVVVLLVVGVVIGTKLGGSGGTAATASAASGMASAPWRTTEAGEASAAHPLRQQASATRRRHPAPSVDGCRHQGSASGGVLGAQWFGTGVGTTKPTATKDPGTAPGVRRRRRS